MKRSGEAKRTAAFMMVEVATSLTPHTWLMETSIPRPTRVQSTSPEIEKLEEAESLPALAPEEMVTLYSLNPTSVKH